VTGAEVTLSLTSRISLSLPTSRRGRNTANAAFDLLSWVIRLMPREITLTSLLTLATLDNKGPRRITELAASEGIAQPSMTVLVTSMERAGLVERRKDPADGRVVLVAITEAGTKFVRTRRDVSARTIARAMTDLSPEEASALLAAAPVIERLNTLLELNGQAYVRGRPLGEDEASQ